MGENSVLFYNLFFEKLVTVNSPWKKGGITSSKMLLSPISTLGGSCLVTSLMRLTSP